MSKVDIVGRGGRVISVHPRVADALQQRGGYMRRDMVAQPPQVDPAAESAALAAEKARLQAQRQAEAAEKKAAKKAAAKKAAVKKAAANQTPANKDASE